MDLWGLFYIWLLIAGFALVIAIAFRPLKRANAAKRDDAPAVLPLSPGDGDGGAG